MRFRIYASWPKVVIILLIAQATLTFIFGSASTLNGYYELIYLVLLLFGTGLAALNATQSQQAIRLFWSFLSAALGLWALLPIFTIYQVVFRHWRNPLLDMTPGFLHIVLIIAGVAARPHLKLPTERPYRTTLSFLILLFFGLFIYAYVLAPYAYDQHASAMILRYEILYFAANLLLISLLFFHALRSRPPWKSIYRHLLGASLVYALGSLVANLAWAWGQNHFGGLTGLPFTASIGWFVWVALQGQQMANDLVRSPRRDIVDNRSVRVLAILVVLAIPLIGMFELFREDEPNQIRVIRLVLVQVSVLLLGLVTVVRAFLANRDLVSGITLANDRLRLAVEAGKMYAYEWEVATDSILRSVECTHVLDWIAQPTRDTRERMLASLHPDDRRLFDAAVATLSPANPDFQLSYRVMQTDGKVIWLENSGRALFNKTGKLQGTVGMIMDVSERKQLEEARFRHAAIVESSDDGIISKSLDGVILSWNLGAQRMFGYTEAEVVGQPIAILIPTGMRDEEDKIVERIKAGERIEHYETIRMTKTGKKINVSVIISPIKDTTGRVVGVSEIARDITERKQAEETLRASEERFRLAAQAGKMFAYEWDAATDIIKRSPEFVQVLGRDGTEQTTGRQILGQVHAEDRGRVMAAIAELSPEKPDLQINFRMVRADGTTIWVERSSRAEFNKQRKLQRIVGMVADITERKRAEIQLHESEERFRLVATTAPVMIWMSGPDKLCTYFNQPWLAFTGRSIHQELGNGWAEGVHAEDLERCLETYKQAFDRRESFEMEYRLRRHDGEFRWIFDCGVPRFNADGSFAGYIGSASDLTDQKLAREALEQVAGQLIDAQEKERSRLARELHDDICQRLAMISLKIEKATKGWGSGQSSVGDQLEQIWQQCSNLTGDVQALSHELHPSILYNLGLATAVKSFCREVSKQNDAVVDLVASNIPSSLPQEVSLSLFRVVQEALRNAVKHSGQKHFGVRLQAKEGEIELEVSDRGVGFEEANMKNGGGLGLVSMSERIHQVNGTFEIDSQRNAGTRIRARVPLATRQTAFAKAAN
jgi:PAS domain S-box-containing protein